MTTPFEKEGYTKETKFRVLRDYCDLKAGDIVWLGGDDHTDSPLFTNSVYSKYMYFPRLGVDNIHCSLEVCKEESNPTLDLKELPEQVDTSNTMKSESVGVQDTNEGGNKLSFLARIIVSQKEEYNGHLQLCVDYKPSLEELTDLLKELDTYYTNINHNWSVCATIESCGGGSIRIRDYWEEGQAPVKGHKDRLIFGFGG